MSNVYQFTRPAAAPGRAPLNRDIAFGIEVLRTSAEVFEVQGSSADGGRLDETVEGADRLKEVLRGCLPETKAAALHADVMSLPAVDANRGGLGSESMAAARDEGFVFAVSRSSVERQGDLDALVATVLGDADGAARPVAMPISSFAYGGGVRRALDALLVDQLQAVRAATAAMRDRIAAEPIFASEQGREMHDRLELGRRSAALALLTRGAIDRGDAESDLRALRSESSRRLEWSLRSDPVRGGDGRDR